MRLSVFARKYVEEYAREINETQRAADLAGRLVRDTLERREAPFYTVTERAKSPESVRWKVNEKAYTNPRRQMTDVVGVRVITHHEDEIETAVGVLRAEFEVDEARSVDKREILGLREFGYRSVHLILRLREPRTRLPELRPLVARWFEVQVRSSVEHVWAEIEHEVVYKSGIQYKVKGHPGIVYRGFGALAGAMEIVDKEFTGLRRAKDSVIDFYKARYGAGGDQGTPFDVARLLAFLEIERPQGLSWRAAARAGRRFVPQIERYCVAALKSTRLNSARALRRQLRSGPFRVAAESFARSVRSSPTEISHLGVVALATAVKRPMVLEDELKPLRGEASLMEAIRAGRARRTVGRVHRRR